MPEVISSDTSDLWWLRPERQQESNLLGWAQIAAQRQARQDALRNQAQRTLIATQTAQAKMALQRNVEAGQGALAQTLSEIATDPAEDRWLKPESYKKFLDVGVRHPVLYGSAPWKGAEALFQHARQADEQRSVHEETERHHRALEEATTLRLGQEEITPEIMDVDGERVIRLGKNHWQYLGKVVPTEKLPPSLKRSIYKDQLSEIDKELENLPAAGTVGETSRGTKAQREDLEKRRADIRIKRDALASGAAPTPTPPATAAPATIAKPSTKAAFDALPSGTRFIDPEGKERIKP